MKHGKGKIKFEEIFEENLKEKFRQFLESGRPSAYLTQALLISAALGGVIAVGAIAPNLFSALGKMSGRSQKIKKGGFYKLRRNFYELRRKKLIEYVSSDGGEDIYRVNENGKKILKKFMFNNMLIPKPDKWDGKWHMVAFDVPHAHKKAREALRRKLRDLGFYQLQKSVWIHPFPCENEIWYVADVFNVRKYIEVVAVTGFSSNKTLSYFKDLLMDFS